MGMTLWQMWTQPKTPAWEFYNPLALKHGMTIQLDEIGFKGYDFRVNKSYEYTRRINSVKFVFTDYLLDGVSLKDTKLPNISLKLRFNPLPKGDVAHNILLLQLYDSLKYDKGFYEVVTDKSQKFEVRNEDIVDEFWRINDVQDPYRADVTIIKDGYMALEGKRVLEYWDYARETPDEAGNKHSEFLFIEMDKDTGWFEIWRGVELNPHRVLLF